MPPIFFLVTTTIETDSGINRKLPPMEDVVDPPVIKQRNIFTVVLNTNTGKIRLARYGAERAKQMGVYRFSNNDITIQS